MTECSKWEIPLVMMIIWGTSIAATIYMNDSKAILIAFVGTFVYIVLRRVIK